jgi:hypothetical protein
LRCRRARSVRPRLRADSAILRFNSRA